MGKLLYFSPFFEASPPKKNIGLLFFHFFLTIFTNSRICLAALNTNIVPMTGMLQHMYGQQQQTTAEINAIIEPALWYYHPGSLNSL